MTANNKKTVTRLQDLADIAGVSRATASRALNNSTKISTKTRQKIQALAREHNYVINRQAQDLRLSRTSVISVVFMLDVDSQQHMSDPFFLDMLGGIADRLAKHDYDLLLVHAPIIDVRELRDNRVFRKSEGIIFIGQGKQLEQLNELAQNDNRIVVWGYPAPDKNYVLVGGDNFGGGYQSAKHLLELNHRRIAFFGNTENSENAARYRGYATALNEYGIEVDPTLQADIPFEMRHARELVINVVKSQLEIDAIVCASDVIALAAISTYQELGVSVPNDISIVGYDDIGLASYVNPPLTTVRQHIRQAGAALVDTVLSVINNEPVSDTIIPSELVVRKSTTARK